MVRQVLTYPDIPPVLTQAQADTRYALAAHNHDAAYSPIAHNHDATYLKITDATATYVPKSGGSVMTGLLGPNVNNTHDLGTAALRWNNVYGRIADLTAYLVIGPGTATTTALYVKALTDSQYRYTVRADGLVSWGPGGSTAPDTTLFRNSAGTLGFNTGGAGATALLASAGISFAAAKADAQVKAYYVDTGWGYGPGGSTGVDAWFSRIGVNQMQSSAPTWANNWTLAEGNYGYRHGASNYGTMIYAKFGYGGDGNNPRMQFGCNAWFPQFAGGARPAPVKDVSGLASGVIFVEASGSGGGTDGQTALVDFIYQDGGWTGSYWTPFKVGSRGAMTLWGGPTEGVAFLCPRATDSGHAPSLALKHTTAASYARFTQAVAAPRADITVNAYYDGSNWQRDDPSRGATLVYFNAVAAGTDASFIVQNSMPGANPIAGASIKNRLQIDGQGIVTLNPDTATDGLQVFGPARVGGGAWGGLAAFTVNLPPFMVNLFSNYSRYGMEVVPSVAVQPGQTGVTVAAINASMGGTNATGAVMANAYAAILSGPTISNSGTISNSAALYVTNPATGGAVSQERAIIHGNTGASLTTAGAWTNAPSWRANKEDIRYVEDADMDRLSRAFVEHWRPARYRPLVKSLAPGSPSELVSGTRESDHDSFFAVLDDLPEEIREVICADASGSISTKDMDGLLAALLRNALLDIMELKARLP